MGRDVSIPHRPAGEPPLGKGALAVPYGRECIYAFRFGSAAYGTDKSVPYRGYL